MTGPLPHVLTEVTALAGSTASGGVENLLSTAERLDGLARVTGYQSLHLFADAFRALHDDINNDQGGPFVD